MRAHALATRNEEDEPELLTRFSQLSRLLRIIAWCCRWLPSARRGRARTAQYAGTYAPLILRAEELDQARLRLIRLVQSAKYEKELAAVESGAPLPVRSELRKLNPFLDPQGLLRVGGRLRHSLLSPDQKHPVILPSRSHLSKLIMEACHQRMLHGGVQLMLGVLRQEYWIPRGRALAKRCVHRCLTCLQWRAASPQPLMGDLPSHSV